MKIIFSGYSEYGGVYKITNTLNERLYVGSTGCFRKRAMAHMNNLVANTHLNTFLQNDFNKCGSDMFRFEILEVVSGNKEDRLIREQFFIDQYYDNQKQCYNLVKLAKDTRSGTRNRNIINRETDGRCKSPSPEVLAKRSKRIKEAKASPEQKEKARQNALNGLWKNHNANIKVVNMYTGEEAVIQGSIRQWCLERGLSYKSFHLMTKKKTKSSGGWRCFS